MTALAWITAGVVVWAVCAAGIASALGRAVRLRDRQVPVDPDEPGTAPLRLVRWDPTPTLLDFRPVHRGDS